MKKFIMYLFLFIVVCILFFVFLYFNLCKAVSKDSKENISIYIDEGSTYSSIAPILKENKLIKSEIAYKIYLKLNKPEKTLEYGEYSLKSSYDLEELLAMLQKGSISTGNTVTITFYEGKNMRNVIKIITEKFGFKEKDILSKLSNSDYLDTLINDYWFIDESIKSKDLYYSLEGYLFPDTYEFYESSDLDTIFRKLLDNMKLKLEPYKEEIENNKYSFHELLTLASVVEQEAGRSKDRKGVAGVFYNRINSNIRLGSDVTTYYAEKTDDFTKDLKWSQLNDCNGYNTRASCMNGKLPIGPICNPSLESIIASIEPTNHKYYYFAADKNGKTYFNETENGHINTVNKLKREDLWIEYN